MEKLPPINKINEESALKGICAHYLKHLELNEGKIICTKKINDEKVNQKINNLISILENLDEEEFDKFMERDFETDIWNLI